MKSVTFAVPCGSSTVKTVYGSINDVSANDSSSLPLPGVTLAILGQASGLVDSLDATSANKFWTLSLLYLSLSWLFLSANFHLTLPQCQPASHFFIVHHLQSASLLLIVHLQSASPFSDSSPPACKSLVNTSPPSINKSPIIVAPSPVSKSSTTDSPSPVKNPQLIHHHPQTASL